jgi:Uma2 family endonuclease
MKDRVTLQQCQAREWISAALGVFVEHHDIGTMHGPRFIVRLPKLRRCRMPDISFVRKQRTRICRKYYIDGPPDLIMEVVAPDTVARDYREKYLEYEKAGIREYWIVDPISQRTEAHTLGRSRKYRPIAVKDGKIASVLLPGFYLRPEWLFGAKRPTGMKALKEMGVAT